MQWKRVLRRSYSNPVCCVPFITRPNPETRSPSSSLRRLLSGGRSSSEVSPWQLQDSASSLPPNRQVSSTKKLLQEAVKQLDAAVLKTEENSDNRSNPRFTEVRTLLESNAPQLGQLCEKVGGASTSQIAGVSQEINAREWFEALLTVLKDVGQLHWVGAVFIILGILWDRYNKTNQYPDELYKVIERLRDTGRLVLEVYGQMKDPENSEAPQTIQRAVKMICDSAEYCCQAQWKLKKASWFKRAILVEAEQKKLESYRSEIDQIIMELQGIQSQELLRRGKLWAALEPTIEDTELIGNEERVKAALDELKTYERASGARAIVLTGTPGIGKSTVGQHVVHQLQEEKKFSKENVCMMDMRELNVVRKQEDLYSRFCKGNPLKFSNSKQGRGELAKLPRKPCLILFDNVQKPSDLEELLPGNLDNWPHPESILVVTTTNEEVVTILDQKRVICYHHGVQELQPKDSKSLFLRKVFRNRPDSPDSAIGRRLALSQIVGELLHFCHGVPLVISVVGSYIWFSGQKYLRTLFRNREEDLRNLTFDTAFERLQSEQQKEFVRKLEVAAKHALKCLSEGDPIISPCDQPLERSLQLACEQLGPQNSSLHRAFLDIVAVHLGRRWEDVELICGEGNLDALKQMSMVKRLVHKDGSCGAFVQVHPVLRRVPDRLQSSGNSLCQPSDSRVVLANLVSSSQLPECFESSQGQDYAGVKRLGVHILKLDHCGEVLTASQLDLVTPKLEFLEIISSRITGSCKRDPRKLKWYRLRDSPSPYSMSSLMNVVILDLDMRKAGELEVERIESMPQLQKLKLENSRSLKTVGPNMPNLRSITVESCPHFESLRGLNASAVQEVKVANCPNFDDSTITGLTKLERLSLTLSERSRFSVSFFIPQGVQIVDLSRNTKLETLPKFQAGTMIQKLNLRSCSSLKSLGQPAFAIGPSLEYLDLGGCASLQLPPCWLQRCFPRLEVLDVHGCQWYPDSLELSGLRQSVKVIGLRPEAADGVPTGCGGLGRCVRRAISSSRCVFRCHHNGEPSKKNLGFKQCVTFPPVGKKDKYL